MSDSLPPHEMYVASQASLSMEFSKQEYWSGLPCPSPEDLQDLGIEPVSLMSLALAGGLFTTEPPGKPWGIMGSYCFNGYRASVCNDEKFLELDSGGVFTAMWMYIMPLNFTLING